MDHAVDVARQAHEQAELGDVADLAVELEHPPDTSQLSHGLAMHCFRPSGVEALGHVDVQHHHFDFLQVDTILRNVSNRRCSSPHSVSQLASALNFPSCTSLVTY